MFYGSEKKVTRINVRAYQLCICIYITQQKNQDKNVHVRLIYFGKKKKISFTNLTYQVVIIWYFNHSYNLAS